MCGIVGAVNVSTTEPIDIAALEAANKRIVHRGPDDTGSYVGDGIALAMRRLSIVDIPGGRQPMSNEDGTIQLVYNGETYNHSRLRAELEGRGHRFVSRSDTEVVVHAYEEWGAPRFLQRMRGQAALAIWDSRTRTLVLARDRFGIKPLYYTVADGRLVFASEVRPLLGLAGRTATLNLEGLGELMSVSFVSGPRTLFEGVHKLQAGHYLTVRDGAITERRYWGISHVEPRRETLEEAAEGFADILREAIEIRMMADVPLGALLSGGIDSAVVTAMANARAEDPLKTVSIGFPDDDFDESARARDAAAFIGTDHHAFSFPDLGMDRFPEVLRQLEEPIVTTAFMSGHFIMETVREAGLTVVLGGDGADELLGGYRWHHWDRLARPLSRLPQPVRRLIARSPLLTRSGRSRMGLSAALGAPGVGTADRYRGWLSNGPPDLVNAVIAPGIRPEYDEGVGSMLARWEQHVADAGHLSAFDQLLWLESQTRLVDFANHSHDRNSMAFSVEARVPFLDHELWEYTMGLPRGLKVRGRKKSRVEKVLLRQAARGLIPEATRHRRKQGLTGPHDRWLRQERLADWAEELLTPRRIRDVGVFVPEVVGRLRRQHQRGVPNRGRLLLGILCVQTWANEFTGAGAPK